MLFRSIGGMTQYIEFDEVISKSATETTYGSQPLGDIAAIGRGGKPVNNGHIHYQCEEPGYIMGLMAITPMIDYSQGNDFDLNLQTIDDLHKPALDGIGYQDLLCNQMHGEALLTEAIGKQPAWLNYMTDVNRTYADFAAGESESYMVLNRVYDINEMGEITNASTYISPKDYTYIFATNTDTNRDFWVQIGKKIIARRVMSAAQIPLM